MVEYHIPGPPTPLHRPRFAKGKVYNDQKCQMLIDCLLVKHQHGKRPLFQEPIHLEVSFIFELPKSWTARRKDLLLNKPHYTRPDLDNLVKYVMDICTGALYTDDKLITSISAEKRYGLDSKTIFTFTKL